MTFAVIIFVVSGLSICIMLYIKMHEAEIGRYHFFPVLRASTDHVARKVFGSLRWTVKVVTSKKFWIALVKFIIVEFKENVLENEHVVKTAKKFSNKIRGRKAIKNQGPVSFYLRDVSEYKDDLPNTQ
jgi:nucleoside diphosphate kinase